MHGVLELDRSAFQGRPAWWMAGELEKQGKVFKECFNAETAINQAFGWMVGTQELYVEDGDGGFIKYPGYVSTVREDLPRNDFRRYFSPVGDGYKIIQNHEIFQVVDGIIGETGAHYASAGTLFNGRRVWVLAKHPWATDILGDPLEDYLLGSSSHDGTRANDYRFTRVRVECANTLEMALNRQSRVSCVIRHTENALSKIAEVRKVLLQQKHYCDEHSDCLRSWAKRRISDAFVKAYLEALFPGDTTRMNKKKYRVLELFRSDQPGAKSDALRGTAYGVYNAITHFIQHDGTTACRNDADGNPRNYAEARMDRVIWGGGARQRDQAAILLEKALEAEKGLASVAVAVTNSN